MSQFAPARALRAVLTGLAMAVSANAARADIKDYEFQLVDAAVPVGPEAIIGVRLVNKITGKPVPDAVIFTTRLDMTPDGMAGMATKVTAMPGLEPGTYRFRADVSMAGGWLLSLGAKVQGETGSLTGKLVVKAAN